MCRISALATFLLLLHSISTADNTLPIGPVISDQTHHKGYVAVQTNAAAWGIGVMNAALEIQTSGKLTFELPLFYSPWFQSSRTALRIAATQPALKWWFRKPRKGHFLAPHISVGWFNAKAAGFRYQDNGRPALGAGISYGYSFPLKDGWNMELSAGVGWLSLRYDRFHNIANGSLVDLRQTSYFGIDHIGVSFSYRFVP